VSDLRTFCWGALGGLAVHTLSQSLGLLTEMAKADPFGSKLQAMFIVACLSTLLAPWFKRTIGTKAALNPDRTL
jgi:glycerol kinase